MITNATKGLHAEKLAAQFLKAKGLKLITSRFRCKHGEIDLIMQEKKHLVFIEVRFRSSRLYGSAIASVNYSKQQKIKKTIQMYMWTYPQFKNQRFRFDIIGIHNNLIIPEFSWLKNAFII